MIWIPFDQCDDKLENFAKNGVPGEFIEHAFVKSANPGLKVKKDEGVLVVAHGNGVAICNVEDGGQMLQAKEFAQRLGAILPKGYTGTIKLWSCQAARPWKYIPGARKQLEERLKGEELEQSLEISYLTGLCAWLQLSNPKQLVGPIGFITLDLPASNGKIYHCEERKLLGPSIGANDGFVHAGFNIEELKKAYPDFCDDNAKEFKWEDLSKSEDDDDNESDYEGNGDSDSMVIEKRVLRPRGAPVQPVQQAYGSRAEYLDAIVKNTPFGQTTQPLSFNQRLKKLQEKRY